MVNSKPVNYLRQLPAVDEIMRSPELQKILEQNPRNLVVNTIRQVLEKKRRNILAGQEKPASQKELKEKIIAEVLVQVEKHNIPGLRRVINATGVVIHTNLGRALLSKSALQAVGMVASGYSNLELNLDTGKRGSRYAPLEDLLVELTGAEAALVVNNNASAVLLALGTLARNKEVIVSRGQLVEIGGSFRIPDVMGQSGARLVEVGTTNKTYPDDYRRAVNENTALLLNVHTSNYRIVGFTRETSVKELVEVGKEKGIPVMSDLGSGSLVDLRDLGLPYEPTVKETVAAGADIVTFSGDKLLGGPQAGIIVGKRNFIEKMKKNPLTRAIRIDKFTVAALEATLREYRDPSSALANIPTLRMLAATLKDLYPRAKKLLDMLNELSLPHVEFNLVETVSRVGGGALPTAELPSCTVEIIPKNMEVSELASRLRKGNPAVIGRIQDDRLLLDIRTVQENEDEQLFKAIAKILRDAG